MNIVTAYGKSPRGSPGHEKIICKSSGQFPSLTEDFSTWISTCPKKHNIQRPSQHRVHLIGSFL